MTIEELIRDAHAMAVSKGWWDGERSVVDQVNNFHAEISEAWEEYRHGRMETWWSTIQKTVHQNQPPIVWHKPEGFWVEIADLCIRLADTMGAHGWVKCSAEVLPSEFADMSRFIGECHSLVETLLQATGRWHDQAGGWAMTLLRTCIETADRNGIDLSTVIAEKMKYNATRPHRHGGLQA